MLAYIFGRKELDLLAEALLQYETLDADDIKSIVENKRPPPAKVWFIFLFLCRERDPP